MAESLVDIGDDPEKNFILAKLVSLFGDDVEFDVISLVAQENEWKEEKCINCLKVLGDYKEINTDSKFPYENPQPLISDASNVFRASSNNLLEPPKKTEVEEAAERRARNYTKVAATTKTGKPKMAGNAGNTQGRILPIRQLSPSNTGVQKSVETQEHHDSVKELIKSGVHVLILLRGLPGSGKSTLAKNLLSTPGARGSVHSTDEFFHVPRGGKGQTLYQYDPLRLGEAHEWNRVQVLRAIAHGVTPIIVDNTNVQKWEMLPYVEMALEPWEAENKLRNMAANGSLPKNNICSSLGPARKSMIGKKCSCGYIVGETCKVPYEVELLEPLTWWYRNPARLAKVNQHGVSQKKITQMLSNFDFNVTGKTLVNHMLKIKSNTPKIPQRDNTKSSNQTRKQATSSGLSGAPLYNIAPTKPVQGNQYGARPRHTFPINLSGNNVFNPPAVNQFQTPARFPPAPHPQFQFPPFLLNFQAPIPPGLAFPNKDQSFSANTQPQMPQHLVDQCVKDKPKKENVNIFSLDHQSSSSKSGSNISSVLDDNKSGSYSSNSGDKNEKPFKGLLTTSENDIPEKSLETVSFVGSECKEMTEEELNEWMKNNSRWGWESSDDDSEEDEYKADANEPKPERVLKLRHKDNGIVKDLKKYDIGDEKSQNSKDDMLDRKEASEWVIEKDDPLISWNTPEVETENKEEEPAGPLPPRDSRRKRLTESLTDPDDSPEEEKKNIVSDQTEVDKIQQIYSLLGELEVKNKGLDFYKEVSQDNSDIIKVDENSSVRDNRDSVDVLGDLAECKNSDSAKGYVMLKKDMESLVKLNDLSSADTGKYNQLKPEICTIESKSMLIETGTVSSTCTDDTMNLNPESVSRVHDRKETLLIDFDEISPTKPVEPITDATSVLINSIASSEELDSCLMESNSENSEVDSFFEASEKNEMTPENFMLLAPLIKEGIRWLEHGYKGLKYKDIGDSEKKDDFKVSQASTCEQTFPVHESETSTAIDSAQVSEDISSSESTPTLQAEVKVQLTENLNALVGNQTNENTENFDSVPVREKETIKVTNTSILSEISLALPEVKETETSSHLKATDNVILETEICSHDVVKFSEDETKDVQNVITSASNICTFSEGVVSNKVPDLKNAQEITKSDAIITTSVVESILKNSVISDENEMQSFIASTCAVSHSLTSELDHSSEKVASSTSREPSDVEIESVVEKEQKVSLLEILENLRKQKLADKISRSTIEPPIVETREIFSSEKADQIINSERKSYPMVKETEKELNNVSELIELCADEEKDGFVKATKEREKCVKDWGVLYKDEGDTVDLDHKMETFPLILDPNFIKQICQKFGNPYEDSVDESSKFSSGNNESGVTVQVPANLARKLHECWLKTQWNTILDEEEASQKMVIEDELLAHQLQALEEEDLEVKREHKSLNTPNLREIMDMEMAMAIYKADQNRNTATPQKNNLSTRLSWDILTKEFPHIPQNVITEVFSAYNFSYESTREALVASLPDYERGLHENQVKDVVSPEILAAQEKVLIEKAKLESLKSKEPPMEEEKVIVESEDEGSWEAQVDQARKAASLNRRLQKERHAQAQAASRSGIPSAAAYYCRMASLHKQKVDEANRKAANILSRVFTGEYNDLKGATTGDKEISQPPITLDMHSMTVLEALRVLNAFLDAHAEWLRNSKRKSNQNKMVTLFLITGRGVNSLGGIPRIKPAVEKQLEKRGVWYEELNPGLLRVMVSANLPPSKKL